MRCWHVLAVGFAMAVGGAACSTGTADGRITEYELRLDVRADGSTAVEERVQVELGQDTAGRIVLTVPAERVDAVEAMSVEVDGAPVNAPDVELRPEPGGGLAWLGGAAAGTHEVRLRYEARGTLEVRGARGVLFWPVVPPGSGTVEVARITITWPEGAVPMEGPGVGQGWEVAVKERTAVLSARDVDRSARSRIYLDLVLADTSFPEPDWQLAGQRARQLAPAFISAGLFFIVVALGVLLMIRIQYPPAAAVVTAPPAGPPVETELADELVRLPRWRSGGETVDRLVGAGLIDRERLVVGRGLRISGLVVVVVGLVAGLVAASTMQSLGPALLALPAGLVAAGLILFVRGAGFSARTTLGLEVGMLHSRRLRSSREP